MRHTDQNRKPTHFLARPSGRSGGPFLLGKRAGLAFGALCAAALPACSSWQKTLAPAPSAAAAPDPSRLKSDGYDAPDLGSAPAPYRSIAYTDLPPAAARPAVYEAPREVAAVQASSPYFTEAPAPRGDLAEVPPAPRGGYPGVGGQGVGGQGVGGQGVGGQGVGGQGVGGQGVGGQGLPDLDEIVVTDGRTPAVSPSARADEDQAFEDRVVEPARYAAADAATQGFRGETRSVMNDARRPDAAPSPAPAPAPAPAYEPVAIAQAPVAQGGYALHLASYRGADQAASGWDVLTRTHPVLSQLTPRRTRIDLPDQGAFVRLIAGPFGTDADAQDACGALEQAGTYCAVVPFGGAPL